MAATANSKLSAELELLKLAFKSSSTYLSNLFNEFKKHLKQKDLINKVNSFEKECKTELTSEMRANLAKEIDIIEAKLKELKESEEADVDDADLDEPNDPEEEDDDEDDDDDEEDEDEKEISNLIQNATSRIQKWYFNNRTLICLNIQNCKEAYLLNGLDERLVIVLDEYLSNKGVESLKSNAIFNDYKLTNEKIKLKLLKEKILSSNQQILECKTDLTGVKDLSLYNNQLTTIESNAFDGLVNLRILNLSWNKFTLIPPSTFKDLHSLLLLSLSGNPLTNVDPDTFKELTNLQVLRMSYNQLTNIDAKLFNKLSNLQELWLSYNQLSQIDPNTFSGLSKLNELRLTSNQLTNIEQKTFNGLNNLKILDLRFNRLDLIDPHLFDGLNNLTDCYFLRKHSHD